jgi:hypothetical protein
MKKLLLLLALGCSTTCFGQIKKTLRTELLEIYKTDQDRAFSPTDKDFMERWTKQNKIDSINLIRVSKILDSIGFPGKTMVGDTAYLATFYVIQHSNLKNQEKYLPLFQKAAEQNEIEWKYVVMMIDRAKVYNHEKQIYGTQLRFIKDPKTGNITDKSEFEPIEDEKNANKRRQVVGLGPIEEYAKELGINYEPK